MILLTYLNNNKSETHNYLDISSFICTRLKNDLILFSDHRSLSITRGTYGYPNLDKCKDSELEMLHANHTDVYTNKPIEDISSRKIDNIILIDFDNMHLPYLESLVRVKSKKTNIIGINVSYNDTFKEFQLFMQELKNQKMSRDEIMVGLSLKYNSSSLVNHFKESFYINRNLNVKEITSINAIEQYIKR